MDRFTTAVFENPLVVGGAIGGIGGWFLKARLRDLSDRYDGVWVFIGIGVGLIIARNITR